MELKLKIVTQLNSLDEASQRLSEAISQPKSEFTRDSVIQRFEFTFEMMWKLLQTILLSNGIECASPRNCLRLAAQQNLISNVEKWLEYQEARNLSSHTYHEVTAKQVYLKAVDFSADIQSLIIELKKVEV